jgi:hypothetical protein
MMDTHPKDAAVADAGGGVLHVEMANDATCVEPALVGNARMYRSQA